AVFGIDFFKNAFIKAKTEFLFAIPFSLIVYWFADFLRSYWLLLSKTVTASVYLLLKISMLKPRVFIKDGVPWIGARNFVVGIIETCSGIEGIAYFLLLYTSLLIFNWRKLNLKNALFAYIPGLIGVFLVNILRVYLTILVGVFYSQDFAVGLFHTNIGIFLFIVYFIVFWIIAIKFIRK
ncbi:exosortase/archaeosortase family protein, partial [Candidatus Pacearchaeota archaeon]|nr:exosortase/archaeosortase family protein [Candidatus Pacearchaeota archaeon]